MALSQSLILDNSLRHALSPAGMVTRYQSSVPSSNSGRLPFVASRNVPVPQRRQGLTHVVLTNSAVGAQLNPLRYSTFWSCSSAAFTCLWLRLPVIRNLTTPELAICLTFEWRVNQVIRQWNGYLWRGNVFWFVWIYVYQPFPKNGWLFWIRYADFQASCKTFKNVVTCYG
jgi:hypothetical protein